MNIRTILAAFNSVPMRLFLAQVIVASTALIVNIFSARTLGPEARGELALFMQIAYVANAISVLGRHRAYLKLDSTEPMNLVSSHKDARILSRAPLVLSVLVAVLGAAAIGNGLIAGAALAIGLFVLIYSGVQQKTLRASAIVARNAMPYLLGTIAGQILLLIGAVSLSIFEIRSISIWLMVYGASVMFPYFIVSVTLSTRNGSMPSDDWRLSEVKSLGLKLMPMSAAEIIGARADRFLIPALANFAQLGIYTVVVTMTELIAWPIRNYTDSKVPGWSRQILNGRFKLLREVVFVSIAIGVLSLVVGLALGMVLTPLFGEEFAAGVELVWPLVLAAALHAFAHLGTNLSLAAGYTSLVNAIPIVGIVVSGVSYFLFIPELGALGAAWGLVCGYSASILVSLVGVVRIGRSN